MGTATKPQQARIGARVPREVYETLRHAAELTGAGINHFLVHSAPKEAKLVIEREQVLRLSRRDSEMLLDLRENPPEPNAEFTAAMSCCRKARQSDADSCLTRSKGP